MNLETLRRASIYQRYLRPVIWAPIKTYRVYREIKKNLYYRVLAREDRRCLTQARDKMERWYLDEKNPLVTITTPTYNRARILVEKTLPPVLAQSYTNVEWVIVGDHCTDETGDLLAKISDPRIRFRNLPTRPRYPRQKDKRWKVVGYRAMRLALEMARGSWIAHLDDDDVFTPDHIEKLLGLARAGNYEIVAGVSRLQLSSSEWVERGRIVQGNGAWPQFSHSTVLYRSYLGDCFRHDARCLQVNTGGDGFRWQRMLNVGVRAGFLQEVVTLMPLRPGEAVRSIFQPE